MNATKTTPNAKPTPNTKTRRKFRSGVKAGGAAMWNTGPFRWFSDGGI